MKWLLIGDPHAHPEHNNDRFEWLGKHIMKERPDIIVCIGDFADMPSLSSYDKGTKGFEGRRYTKDIQSVHDALAKLHAPMQKYNKRQQKNKKQQYHPAMYMTLGNHEDRISRAVNSQAELEGVISIADLKYEEHGWELIQFGDVLSIAGWQFTHYFPTGVSGRPISGENIGKNLLAKNFASSVQGHSHILDYATRTTADGNKIHGLSIGCYANPEMIEGWNRATAKMWWHGVVDMHTDDLGNTQAVSFIEQEELKRRYA